MADHPQWTTEVILEIILEQRPEDDVLEFKSSPHPDSLCKTAAAMANRNGGTILLGIGDPKEEERLVGFDPGPDVPSWVSHCLRTAPRLAWEIHGPFEVGQSSIPVYALTIYEARQKPVAAIQNERALYYIREPGESRPMTWTEIDQAFRLRHLEEGALQTLVFELEEALRLSAEFRRRLNEDPLVLDRYALDSFVGAWIRALPFLPDDPHLRTALGRVRKFCSRINDHSITGAYAATKRLPNGFVRHPGTARANDARQVIGAGRKAFLHLERHFEGVTTPTWVQEL